MSEIVADAWKKYLQQLKLHPLRTKVIVLPSSQIPPALLICSCGWWLGLVAAVDSWRALRLSGYYGRDLSRVQRCYCSEDLWDEEAPAEKIVADHGHSGSSCPDGLFPSLIRGSSQLYGFAYGGPFGHFLHKLMEIIFKGKKDSNTIAKKVLLEQLISSPWNNMFFMMYYGLVVEGRPWGLVRSKVRKDYPSVQLTAWKFWPIVGWINYQYMPPQLRVVFHSFVASCWGIFLNLKARSTAIKRE